MLDQMTTLTETIVDKAYARWQADRSMSHEQFMDELDFVERVAVTADNLDGQVCNGGFMQWWGNGYATPETRRFLKQQLKTMGPAALAVLGLLRRYDAIVQDRDQNDIDEDDWDILADQLSGLDTEFYAVNDLLRVELEERLTVLRLERAS